MVSFLTKINTMSYLRYLCLFVDSGVHHIPCIVLCISSIIPFCPFLSILCCCFFLFVLCVVSNIVCVSGLSILECPLFSNVYLYCSCSCCCHFYDQTILSFYVESTGMGVWCCRANTQPQKGSCLTKCMSLSVPLLMIFNTFVHSASPAPHFTYEI
jgi:hypothetical protein